MSIKNILTRLKCRRIGHDICSVVVDTNGKLWQHTHDKCLRCGETWYRFPYKTPDAFRAHVAYIRSLAE